MAANRLPAAITEDECVLGVVLHPSSEKPERVTT